MKSALRSGQRKLPEALRLLEEARQLYLESGDDQMAARVQIAVAEVYRRSGDLGAAFSSLFKAASRLTARSHLDARIGAIHNLISYLAEAGKSAEAHSLLASAVPLYELFPGKLMIVRMRWLEAQVAQNLGHLDHAEEGFRSVSNEFSEREMDFDAALAALELAALLAQQDRHAEVAELAEEMYPIFISKDIPGEATAALVLFADAVRKGAVSADSIRKVLEEVEGSRAGPQRSPSS